MGKTKCTTFYKKKSQQKHTKTALPGLNSFKKKQKIQSPCPSAGKTGNIKTDKASSTFSNQMRIYFSEIQKRYFARSGAITRKKLIFLVMFSLSEADMNIQILALAGLNPFKKNQKSKVLAPARAKQNAQNFSQQKHTKTALAGLITFKKNKKSKVLAPARAKQKVFNQTFANTRKKALQIFLYFNKPQLNNF